MIGFFNHRWVDWRVFLKVDWFLQLQMGWSKGISRGWSVSSTAYRLISEWFKLINRDSNSQNSDETMIVSVKVQAKKNRAARTKELSRRVTNALSLSHLSLMNYQNGENFNKCGKPKHGTQTAVSQKGHDVYNWETHVNQ